MTENIIGMTSVLVHGQEFFLPCSSAGFLTCSGGRLKLFTNLEDAQKGGCSNSKTFPEYGPVDLDLGRQWVSDTSKSTSLETLEKLDDIHGTYINILLAYSDVKEIPPDIEKEDIRNRDVWFSSETQKAFEKLSNINMREMAYKMGPELNWDVEKLVQGWGGRIPNEWAPEELSKLEVELAIEIEFIERKIVD